MTTLLPRGDSDISHVVEIFIEHIMPFHYQYAREENHAHSGDVDVGAFRARIIASAFGGFRIDSPGGCSCS